MQRIVWWKWTLALAACAAGAVAVTLSVLMSADAVAVAYIATGAVDVATSMFSGTLSKQCRHNNIRFH